jgi:hypothetical protein
MSISFIISKHYKLSPPQKTVVGSTWGAAERESESNRCSPVSPSFGTRGSQVQILPLRPAFLTVESVAGNHIRGRDHPIRGPMESRRFPPQWSQPCPRSAGGPNDNRFGEGFARCPSAMNAVYHSSPALASRALLSSALLSTRRRRIVAGRRHRCTRHLRVRCPLSICRMTTTQKGPDRHRTR